MQKDDYNEIKEIIEKNFPLLLIRLLSGEEDIRKKTAYFEALSINNFAKECQKYKNDDRGLYYSQEEVVCGDVVYSTTELTNAIINNINHPEKEAEFTEKHPQFVKALINEKTISMSLKKLFQELK